MHLALLCFVNSLNIGYILTGTFALAIYMQNRTIRTPHLYKNLFYIYKKICKMHPKQGCMPSKQNTNNIRTSYLYVLTNTSKAGHLFN